MFLFVAGADLYVELIRSSNGQMVEGKLAHHYPDGPHQAHAQPPPLWDWKLFRGRYPENLDTGSLHNILIFTQVKHHLLVEYNIVTAGRYETCFD